MKKILLVISALGILVIANIVKNAISFAPTFPGVGIGETDMYKNT